MKEYLSLVKFSHTVFALPFALCGFSFAVFYLNQPFYWQKFLLVILCMISARNSAMGFNRYIDRNYDEKNPRTAIREIPSGMISSRNALIFVAINMVLFIIFTYYINTLCYYLSPVALAVVLGYSLTKRFTFLCHFILGLGLSLAPVGAATAVTGHIEPGSVILGLVVLFWVSGFDIIYALQDDTFDRENKLFSIPAYFGKEKALFISRVFHSIAALILVLFGSGYDFGIYYFIGIAVFISLLIYQHSLVKPDDLSRVNLAFFTTNGFASILFFVFFFMEMYFNH